MEWMVLQIPTALLLYCAALFFCLFDRHYQATKGWFTLLSCGLVLAGTVVLLLEGAELWEAAALLTAFLLLHLEVKE